MTPPGEENFDSSARGPARRDLGNVAPKLATRLASSSSSNSTNSEVKRPSSPSTRGRSLGASLAVVQAVQQQDAVASRRQQLSMTLPVKLGTSRQVVTPSTLPPPPVLRSAAATPSYSVIDHDDGDDSSTLASPVPDAGVRSRSQSFDSSMYASPQAGPHPHLNAHHSHFPISPPSVDGSPIVSSRKSSHSQSAPNEHTITTPVRKMAQVGRMGNLTYRTAELPPEVEELRFRDIEPDSWSMAARQLGKAGAEQRDSNVTSASGKLPTHSDVRKLRKQRVEGRSVQQGHAQYALTYGMMLGIRVVTGRQDYRNSGFGNIDVELLPEDFEQSYELKFDPEGSNLPPFPTPPHKLPFRFIFKDYMPNAFRAVRALSNIDEADYMLSLAGDFNYIEFIANSKSGQFFFYSHDGKYMIKTQTKEESKLLRKMFPSYVQHLTENPDSLLVRFYGMHRVKMKAMHRKMYFLVMSSVFNTPLPIHVKYDLKGSLIGRLTSAAHCNVGAVQKDQNMVNNKQRINLGEENVTFLYETLKSDVAFLRERGVMDYSLLLGIHDKKRAEDSATRRPGVILSSMATEGGAPAPPIFEDEEEIFDTGSIFQSESGGIASADGQEIYFMGIIDILQEYNAGKRTETFFKSFIHDKKQLSSVDPDRYAERFLRFVMSHTDYDNIMKQRMATQRLHAGVHMSERAKHIHVNQESLNRNSGKWSAGPTPRRQTSSRYSESRFDDEATSSSDSTPKPLAMPPGHTPYPAHSSNHMETVDEHSPENFSLRSERLRSQESTPKDNKGVRPKQRSQFIDV